MLTSVPLQMQVAAGIGFLAYLVAMSGLRARHRPIEITGWTLAFSALFLTVLPAAQAALPASWQTIAAGAAVLLVAVFWRKWGHRLASWLGAKSRTSRALQYPTVESWLLDQHSAFTQIGVVLKDGTEISCANTEAHWYGDVPAPVIIASDGAIGLIADRVERPGVETEEAEINFLHDAWGSRFTVIPRDQIAWYWLRVKRVR